MVDSLKQKSISFESSPNGSLRQKALQLIAKEKHYKNFADLELDLGNLLARHTEGDVDRTLRVVFVWADKKQKEAKENIIVGSFSSVKEHKRKTGRNAKYQTFRVEMENNKLKEWAGKKVVLIAFNPMAEYKTASEAFQETKKQVEARG